MAEIIWLADTLKSLTEASIEVRRTMGGALRMAQNGEKSSDAKPLTGDLRDVIEVSAEDESGTYRLMYAVKIADDVIVLDFFKKKSKSGIATPKANLDRIRARLKRVKADYAQR
jgi:phage-related protein